MVAFFVSISLFAWDCPAIVAEIISTVLILFSLIRHLIFPSSAQILCSTRVGQLFDTGGTAV